MTVLWLDPLSILLLCVNLVELVQICSVLISWILSASIFRFFVLCCIIKLILDSVDFSTRASLCRRSCRLQVTLAWHTRLLRPRSRHRPLAARASSSAGAAVVLDPGSSPFLHRARRLDSKPRASCSGSLADPARPSLGPRRQGGDHAPLPWREVYCIVATISRTLGPEKKRTGWWELRIFFI
jgi:hypothetical protein